MSKWHDQTDEQLQKYIQLFEPLGVYYNQEFQCFRTSKEMIVAYADQHLRILIGTTFALGVYINISAHNDPAGKAVHVYVLNVVSEISTVNLELTPEDLQEIYESDRFFQYSTVSDVRKVLAFMDLVKDFPAFIERIKEIHGVPK